MERVEVTRVVRRIYVGHFGGEKRAYKTSVTTGYDTGLCV